MAALVASMLSGAGWGTMSAAAINAIVSPWFVRARPAALGMAYNGGSYRRRDFFTALGSGDCRVGLCDRGSNHRHCLGCRDVGSRGSVVCAPAATIGIGARRRCRWYACACPNIAGCIIYVVLEGAPGAARRRCLLPGWPPWVRISGDGDRRFQPKVITHSGDRDHAIARPTKSA